ncbi:uncharacterized protein LOC144124312 [Amblyomma americanum]
MAVKVLLERVIHGMGTNSMVHVICLLSERTFKASISKQEFELLGPKSATRAKCTGVTTLAKWPVTGNATSVVVRPPATEERSNELFLACSETKVDGQKHLRFIRPGELEGLRMIVRYLNITHLRAAIAPLPFTPNKKFPEDGTLTGLLVHGKADVSFFHTVITEPRAFAADFVFPIRYEKIAYMFPSPRVYTSGFAALRIFSLPVWTLLGASLLFLTALLRVLTYVHKCKSDPGFVVLALFLGQDTATVPPPVGRSRGE